MIVGPEPNLIKRTPKVLIAINSGIQYILNLDWLVDSANAVKAQNKIEVTTGSAKKSSKKIMKSSGRPSTIASTKLSNRSYRCHFIVVPKRGVISLQDDDNLKKYSVKDSIKETLWGFELLATLRRSKQRLFNENNKVGNSKEYRIFFDYCFVIMKGLLIS